MIEQQQQQIDFVNKLDSVFSLLYNDIPDEYDDTINQRLLDTIKNMLPTSKQLVGFLNGFFLNGNCFCLKNLFVKDIQIQNFFLALLAALIEAPGHDEKILNGLVGFLRNDFFCNYSSYNLDLSVKYSIISLLKVLCLTTKNAEILELIRGNYATNCDLFSDSSLFVRRLLVDFFIVILTTAPCDVDFFLSAIQANQTELFVLDFICVLLEKNRDLAVKLLEKLNLNEILVNLHDISYIQAWTTLWFECSQDVTNEKLDETCGILIKKDNFNYLFQFLNKLYDLNGNNRVCQAKILDFYLVPLNLFSNTDDCHDYLSGVQVFRQKELILKFFFINFNNFLRKHQQKKCTFEFDLDICKNLLKNQLLNLDIKNLFLKFLENYLRFVSSTSRSSLNLIYLHVYDYARSQCDGLDECVLAIFRFYLDSTEDSIDGRLKFDQIFEFTMKKIDNLELMVNFLLSVKSRKFLRQIIDWHNGEFVRGKLSGFLFNEISYEQYDLKVNILRLLVRIFEFNLNFDLSEQFCTATRIRELCVEDTEAQIRCTAIGFYSKLFTFSDNYRCYMNGQVNFFDLILNSLKNDLDYEVQLCAIQFFIDFCDVFADNGEFYSNFFQLHCLETLIGIINDVDDYNSQIKMSCLRFLVKFKGKYGDYCRNNCIDDGGLMSEEFLDFDNLNGKLENLEAKLDMDLYGRNPFNILDDIISIYEFNMNENKIIDCY